MVAPSCAFGWASRQQEIILSLNTSELEVAEGSVVEWSDSMCRLAFLSDTEQSCHVATDFAGSLGSVQLGMRTFFALPILGGDTTIGTVCGARGRSVKRESDLVANIRLISEALGEDFPARLGGDEFALLLRHCDGAGAQTLAARIADEFGRAAGGLDMPCTLSIGISSSETCPRLSLLTTTDKALPQQGQPPGPQRGMGGMRLGSYFLRRSRPGPRTYSAGLAGSPESPRSCAAPPMSRPTRYAGSSSWAVRALADEHRSGSLQGAFWVFRASRSSRHLTAESCSRPVARSLSVLVNVPLGGSSVNDA